MRRVVRRDGLRLLAAVGALLLWAQAATAMTIWSFDLPATAFASFGPGKVGANDAIRLAAYDHSVGDGALVPVTDLFNVPG